MLAEKDREEIAREEAESRRAAIAVARTESALREMEVASDALRANVTPGIMVQEEAEERVEIGVDGGIDTCRTECRSQRSMLTCRQPSDTTRVWVRGGAATRVNRPQSGLAQQAAQLASRGNYAVPAAQADDQTQIFSFFAGFNNGGSGNQPANGNGLFTTDLNMPFAQGTYALNVNGGNFYTGGTNITGGDLNNLIAQNQNRCLCGR